MKNHEKIEFQLENLDISLFENSDKNQSKNRSKFRSV